MIEATSRHYLTPAVLLATLFLKIKTHFTLTLLFPAAKKNECLRSNVFVWLKKINIFEAIFFQPFTPSTIFSSVYTGGTAPFSCCVPRSNPAKSDLVAHNVKWSVEAGKGCQSSL